MRKVLVRDIYEISDEIGGALESVFSKAIGETREHAREHRDHKVSEVGGALHHFAFPTLGCITSRCLAQ
jgi:hypothetical protein